MPPRVKLRNHFNHPTANAVAAAKTCYSDSIIRINDLTKDEITRIGKTTYEAGHHTVYQHQMFEFELSNVSRAFTHDFLHNHPFYNSSQNSQRYVRIRTAKATIPPIKNRKALRAFQGAIRDSFDTYTVLARTLTEELTELYNQERSSRSVPGRKAIREINEKAMEAARYALAIASHTHLLHTIDGVTLWRYYRMKNISWEANLVVNKMIDRVKAIDQSFVAFPEEEGAYPGPLLPEVVIRKGVSLDPDRFRKDFDSRLGGRRSLLIAQTMDAERVIADSVRHILGITSSSMSDIDAIDAVLNPAKNRYLVDTVNLSVISPLSRALSHVQYTFLKRLSHTADSQNQRHRTISGSRSPTYFQDSAEPDYVMPEIIRKSSRASEIFTGLMKRIWGIKNDLLNDGMSPEYASYILPNALAVRFEETGSMLNLWYKFTNRSCLRAEEEIWQVTMEEISQVKEIHPSLGAYLGPPCYVRKMAYLNESVSEDVGKTRYCNQGKLYCRQPVWNLYPDVSVENVLKV